MSKSKKYNVKILTEKKPSNPTGRPPIEIDDKGWKLVNQYLEAQCDGASIARMFGMSPDVFYDKIVAKYGEEFGISTFTAYQTIKRMQGKENLRAKQFEQAMLGNKTMMIWLGKQLLNQRDQIEQTITVPQVSVHTLTEKEALEVSTALTALEQDGSNDSLQEESDGSDK